MHFRESDEMMVRDETGKCEMGDWIIVKPMEIKKTINVDYELYKFVYKHGNYICPLTGKRSYGFMFKEDYDRYNIKKEYDSEDGPNDDSLDKKSVDNWTKASKMSSL